MKGYQKEKPIISIHVPKCGGNSFRAVLWEWFHPTLFFHYYDNEKGKIPEKVKLKQKEHFFSPYKRDLCIHGHFNKERGFGINKYYPKVNQFFTFLRDPLEIQISRFFYFHKLIKDDTWIKDGKKNSDLTNDLDQYLEETTSNMLLHFPDGINELNYKEYINKKFIHIGLIENYQQSIDILADKLKRKSVQICHLNESRRTQTPSESSVKKFLEKCSLETKIYQYAIELNK